MLIAIVDDIAEERILLRTRLENILNQKNVEFHCYEYENGEAFLKASKEHDFTVLFLDIYMNGANGIEIAREFRNTNKDCLLIFTTTSLDHALDGLRQGMFAPKNRGKAIEKTEEGIPISQNLLLHGYVADDEIERFPGVTHKAGVHPVMECTQNIPCNPCQDACKKGCISIGSNITSLPIVVDGAECINCGMCVASCSGQAIFLVDEDCGDGMATVTIPYEFLPLPEKGTKGKGLGRDGKAICDAEVVSVKSLKAFDKTSLLTMRIPKEYAMKARFFRAV